MKQPVSSLIITDEKFIIKMKIAFINWKISRVMVYHKRICLN